MNEGLKKLIRDLIEKRKVFKNPAIIRAFQEINRRDFVLEENQDDPYGDFPLPIGFGQTISQPYTVAFMLEELGPKPGEKILDVGSGSGWVTALLAFIVGEQGKIVAVERIKELKEMTEKNVGKYNFIKKGNVEVILSDGSKGYSKEAPFDKIIAGAVAEEIPESWKKQLKVNGRIVCPIGDSLECSIVVIDKKAENEFKEKGRHGFRFVRLIENE